MDPANVPTKFIALPVRENSDCSFGWVANPNLGEEEAFGGRGWYRSKERW